MKQAENFKIRVCKEVRSTFCRGIFSHKQSCLEGTKNMENNKREPPGKAFHYQSKLSGTDFRQISKKISWIPNKTDIQNVTLKSYPALKQPTNILKFIRLVLRITQI